MKDVRFLKVLNEAAGRFPGIWDAAAARRNDAAALSAWAGFLAACVSAGASIGDERWRRLEVRAGSGPPRFTLPPKGADINVADDFGVGLALLMNLLDRQPPSD